MTWKDIIKDDKEKMVAERIYDELGKALSAIDNAVNEMEKDDFTMSAFKSYYDKLKKIRFDLSQFNDAIDAGELGYFHVPEKRETQPSSGGMPSGFGRKYRKE
jgi:hypothetical protein